MSLSLETIQNEIQQMGKGQKKFYTIEDLGSQDALDQTLAFLEDIQFESAISVKAHRESQTGLRNVDAIIVTKTR